MAGRGSGPAPNTLLACIATENSTIYVPSDADCGDGGDTPVDLKTALTRVQAQELEKDFDAFRSAIASFTSRLNRSEVPTMDDLALQRYLERQELLFQLLSNAMKKMNDTAKSIIANLK